LNWVPYFYRIPSDLVEAILKYESPILPSPNYHVNLWIYRHHNVPFSFFLSQRNRFERISSSPYNVALKVLYGIKSLLGYSHSVLPRSICLNVLHPYLVLNPHHPCFHAGAGRLPRAFPRRVCVLISLSPLAPR